MRARVLELVKQHGWNATAFQVLGPRFEYWFDGEDACVAYVDTGAAWVVAGAPLCDEARLALTAERFSAAAREAGRRASFFAVERRFLEATGARALPIGEQPVWSPVDWPAVVAGSRNLKEQLRRARAKGVAVREVDAPVPAALLGQLNAIRQEWQRGHGLPPMGFLVEPVDFAELLGRRLWLAEQGGALVAALVVAPVPAREGVLFEELCRHPGAPNGTSELLLDAALRALAQEGHRYATLGLAPLSGDVGPWLRAAAKLSSGLYDFRGLRRFKSKLKPARWDPLFIAVPPGASRPLALWDALGAFAHGRRWRFGVHALSRLPGRMGRRLFAGASR